MLCNACADGRPVKLHACVECGKESRKEHHGRCLYHAWRFYVPKVVARLSQGIRQRWVKKLFSDYAKVLVDCRIPRSVPRFLRRDLQFFVTLDGLFGSRKELTNTEFARRVDVRVVKQFHRATGFLQTEGIIASLDTPEVAWIVLSWRMRTLRESLDQAWAREVFQSFETQLHERRLLYSERGHTRTREPMSPNGIRCALRGAAQVLSAAISRGAQGAHEIDQKLLTHLLVDTKVDASRVARFVRFLNEQPRFRRLTLPRAGRRHGEPKAVLDGRAYLTLVADFLHPRSRLDLKYSIICLLSLVYVQRTDAVVSWRRDRVRQTEGGVEAKFSNTWVRLHEAMQPLLTDWLGARTEVAATEATGASPYLFPGRNAGTHVTMIALGCWLAQRKLKPSQLWATGVAQLVQSPDFRPRLAVQTLGLRPATVAKYMKLFAPLQAEKLLKIIGTAK